MVENLVSSAPLDHQNISSDGGGQKFRETEAIENENLLESQRDLEQNDITLTDDNEASTSHNVFLSEKSKYDLNKTYVVTKKHTGLTGNIPKFQWIEMPSETHGNPGKPPKVSGFTLWQRQQKKKWQKSRKRK